MPDVTILPLKRIKYFITPPAEHKSPIDPITKSFIGNIDVEIQHFFDQKPLLVSMKSLMNGDNVATELDAIPPPDSIIPKENVKNEVIKNLLKEHPEYDVKDAIWNFALQGAKQSRQ